MPRRRLAACVAALTLAWSGAQSGVAVAAAPEAGSPQDAPAFCAAALSPDDATQVFRALRAVQDRDGCHLEAVETSGSESALRWSRDGHDVRGLLRPAICPPRPGEVNPLEIGAFHLAMAPDDRARCPTAVAALVGLLAHSAAPASSPPQPRDPAADPAGSASPSASPSAPGPSLTPRVVTAPPTPDPLVRATIYAVLPLCWLLFAGLGTYALARAVSQAPRRALLLAAIAALGLALRLGLAPWGPGDLFDNVESAYGGPELTDFGRYGRAPEALLHLLFTLFPANHDTFIVANLLAAALCVPALAGLASRLGWSHATGAVAGLLFATAPLLVRFGPTYNRFSLAILLMLTAFWALLAWLDTRRPTLLPLAALAIALASQCRPELLHLPAFAAALPLAWRLADRGRLPPRALLALSAAALCVALLVLPQALSVLNALSTPEWSDHVGAQLVGRPIFNPEHNIFLDRRYTPIAWMGLAALGLLRPPGGSRALLLWLVALALTLTAVIATIRPADNLWDARYHLAAHPFYLLLTAAGLTALTDIARGHWLPVLATLLAALPLPLYPYVLRDTALSQQYRFLRQNLAKVPDGCVVLTFDPHGEDLGLRPTPSQSLVAGRHHAWRFDLDDPDVRDAPCLAFYLNAACDAVSDHHAENRARHCAAVLETPGIQTLAETQVDAASSAGHAYHHPRVPVGLYLLRAPPP
ncbi:MAG: hypothetical protein R3F39_05160 [Myxococcota bacterium]